MAFRIPVLLYHAVVDKEINSNIHPVNITLIAFENQMKWLHDNGYKAISITEMLHSSDHGNLQKKLVITFDDGYLSLLNLATPILEKFNFTATVFLTTAAVEGKSYSLLGNNVTNCPEDDRPLTWEELKKMKDAGWDIQAHGSKHFKHNELTKKELFEEINSCKTAIVANLNYTPTYYAFPYGSYNTLCLKMLKKLNFKAGFSTHAGLANSKSDNLRFPRVEIFLHDSMEIFTNKVLSGYATKYYKLKSRLLFQVYRNSQIKDLVKSCADKLKSN
ncbi:MAG: polysaccharide deacetylase family protein [Pyrinomonadaceae bacterium]|nr:polysaccharide deacetylase family protein [Sphingobacteriaceae bacterium]